jgi:hypothetical protein
MKVFLKYFVRLALGTLIIMVVLDFTYTAVLEKSEPRSKFQLLRSLKNQKVHYLFLGSSRVENGIVPALIKEKTNKEAINLGFQASKLSDIYTILQLIKEYNIQSEKIFIQIDYIFNIEGGSNILQYELFPFVRENDVTKEYFDRHFSDNKALYYLPFYRYCQNDVKIGFREIFSNAITKKTNIKTHNGYVGLYGEHSNHNYDLPKTIPVSNVYFDKIKLHCAANKINVVYYVAPFCQKAKNLHYITKLKRKIPELKDYSNVIHDSTMFQNCGHLNDKGAIAFTSILMKDLLVK